MRFKTRTYACPLACLGAEVPMEGIFRSSHGLWFGRHMDEGGIPDEYTSEIFKAALADNQVCRCMVLIISEVTSLSLLGQQGQG